MLDLKTRPHRHWLHVLAFFTSLALILPATRAQAQISKRDIDIPSSDSGSAYARIPVNGTFKLSFSSDDFGGFIWRMAPDRSGVVQQISQPISQNHMVLFHLRALKAGGTQLSFQFVRKNSKSTFSTRHFDLLVAVSPDTGKRLVRQVLVSPDDNDSIVDVDMGDKVVAVVPASTKSDYRWTTEEKKFGQLRLITKKKVTGYQLWLYEVTNPASKLLQIAPAPPTHSTGKDPTVAAPQIYLTLNSMRMATVNGDREFWRDPHCDMLLHTADTGRKLSFHVGDLVEIDLPSTGGQQWSLQSSPGHMLMRNGCPISDSSMGIQGQFGFKAGKQSFIFAATSAGTGRFRIASPGVAGEWHVDYEIAGR